MDYGRFCSGLVSVGLWNGETEQTGEALCTALGGRLPLSGQQVTEYEAGYIYRIARDRLLIRSDTDETLFDRITSLVPNDQAAVSDLSHARKIVGLSGPDIPAMMSRVLPIDSSDIGLLEGCFVQTFLQDAVVLLHRETRQTYSLMVPTSFAMSIVGRLQKITEKFI